ncbi:Brp/Blh family beta-carotene 15,15'-dioxygenase [Sphingomonas lenta]|uniref:Probable beta-carotene 15,15'-dioxygenase n=1 Tax=Sphingomonas lenta TaxID=1141887 RepID=A0A2A2SID2_9SPHN|nr:Brp/Blh family beta-carotene 15,15'-dioxygenase [Sphingomonas lenta]PAX08978.1 hypothetical protein CKY28_06470 [Sphingomonas lenta]
MAIRACDRHRAVAVTLLVAAALAGAVLPTPSVTVQLWALVVGVAVGLPHGALDQPAARAVLQGRFGQWWPAPFIGFYLGLAALVLLVWSVVPVIALALFLSLSVAHFGLGDAEPDGALRPMAAFAHGGAVVIAPATFYQKEVASIFEVLASGGGELAAFLAGPIAVMWIGSIAALLMARRTPDWASSIELLTVVAVFAALPPLMAFALYFGVLHAPRATLAETASAGEATCATLGRLLRTAAPASLAAAAAGGVAFMLLRDGMSTSVAVTSIIFIGLAALTVPHIALGVALRWTESRRSSHYRSLLTGAAAARR